MNFIKRHSVYVKTLLLTTGFCILLGGEINAQTPSASFTSNVFSGCPPLSVDFTNLSSQATDYSWDFGNGNTSTLADPTTVYLTPGFYTVTLVAINTLSGQSDTLVATNYIHVIDDPVPDFSASPLTGCAGSNTIVFTNLSSNANNYIWDFGDGNFSTQTNPVHSYLNPGTYTVKLIAGNSYGCSAIKTNTAYITIYPNPPAAFSVNQQSSCDASQLFSFTSNTPGAINWLWDFGDGTTSLLENPSHVYGVQGSFTVSLIVINSNGCSDTLVSPGYINIGPSLVPTFTVNNQAGCVPFNAIFNSTVANATSWLWDFGDGTTSNLENPNHTYLAAGSYNITLTVTTSNGCNGTVSFPAFINVEDLPVASFSVNDPSGCSPHTTFFTNNSTGSISYFWDFGNGTTSTDPNPFSFYPDTGTYTVTLVATSANGCADTLVMPAAVTVNNIIASFSATPRAGCAPLPVDFTASSTPLASTWLWDFGDGTTGSGQLINHVYTAIGNYTITLVATSPSGCTDTIVRTNYVRVYPDSINYTLPDTILVCMPPGTAAFTDPTLGSNYWLWDFGDGDTSNIRNPTHTYTAPGVYTVTLTVGMPGGCTQYINPFAYVNVVPFVVSPITSLITSPCVPYTVELNNLTPGVLSYLWDFGDGTTSTLQNPVHVYAQPGTYTISLLLTSVNGCQTSLTTTVTFGYQNIINVSDTTNCLGDTVSFSLNPLNAFISANWDFGDGNTSSILQPVHVYAATGSYNVSVTVTDTSGCVYTFNYPNQVHISNPVSSFSINQPTSGCVPYTVQFENNSTGATAYYWYFGDGTNSNQANPVHTYTSAGVYTVTLNAARQGCVRSSTITDYITVNEATANFSFSPDSGCSPLTTTFTDLSLNAVSWFWDFGDGTTSNQQHPVHTYNSQPQGPISLIIVDNNGCSDTITTSNILIIDPVIQVSDTFACTAASINFSTQVVATTYLWDFGDGTTSNIQNPSHAYSQAGSYAVTVTCVLASGCTTTSSNPAVVTIEGPVSAFISPTVSVCAPSLVSFVNQSTGAATWLWDFGDGTTSSAQNPSHIYNIPGTYTVTLISYSDSGCTDTLTLNDYITVPGTLTDFSISAINICENTVVQFTDLSINAGNWFWNFGDGSTSNLQHPNHAYTAAGTYTVTLITSDSVGCSSFYSFPNPVTVYEIPDVQATVTPSSGCVPLSVNFINSSTGATVYTWNFGNGVTSNSPDTTYIYQAAGTYYPMLTASSAFGCTDSFIFNQGVAVSNLPVPSFISSITSNCSPAVVSFTNTSTGVSNPTYTWNFGNGQTSTLENPSVTYNSAGTYAVTLTVTNDAGCVDSVANNIIIVNSPAIAASASQYSGCSPVTVDFTNNSVNASNFIWDFGDGTTSTSASPSHTYTTPGIYTVTLIATNSNGCPDTLILPAISIGLSPIADFIHTPGQGCAPLNVSFTSTSTQLDNPTYNWNFGNGQSGGLSADNIIYNSPGTFNVSLIVTNINGCVDSINQSVTVGQTPQAIATASGYNGCAPYEVIFTDSSLNASAYQWQFGDGTSSSLANPVHTYASPGNYQVSLVVTAASGCTDTLAFVSPIHVKQTPVASFVQGTISGCTPVAINFTNTSSNLVNPTFLWDFGNGTTSTMESPSITFSQAGSMNVSMTVTNDEGCADSAFANITINPTPVAQAAFIDSSGCAPHNLIFNSTSLNADSILWNFGDGTISTTDSILHSYIQPGYYQPYLIATTNAGCTDTLIIDPVQVYASPVASFSVNQTSGCSGSQFIFTNLSSPSTGLTYQWNIAGNNYNVQNPSVTIQTPGIHNVSLTVTNQNGCADTMIQNYLIQVFDSLPPPVSPILSVSVLNNTSVEITWSNSSSLDLGAYVLYRLNPVTGVYNEIMRDTTPSNAQMNVTSSHIDGGLNTLSNVYTYKLSTIDLCSNQLPLSALTAHTTINVTAIPVNNDIRVNWTPYLGCTVLTYEITRVNISSGTSTSVATVPSNILTYLDQGFYCPDEYSYRITANALCGSTYNSLSDTSVAVPANALAGQKVEVVRSTVVNDQEVLTEWLPPALAPGRVVQYSVMRSTDNINYVEIAQLPPNTYSYIDYSTNVHDQEYYYRIDVVNDCMVTGMISNEGSSILLKTNVVDEYSKLWWTPYTDWDTGVDYYIIEKEISPGTWQQVKTVDGNQLDTILDE